MHTILKFGVFIILIPECHSLPRNRRRLSAAASCCGHGMPVPRARRGHAAALGSQDPRSCVRNRAASPGHAPSLAMHGNPATWPRRRVRVAAKPLRLFPEHPPGTPHTHTHGAHTHTHLPHRIRYLPHQILPRLTRGAGLLARRKGAEAASQRGGGGEGGGGCQPNFGHEGMGPTLAQACLHSWTAACPSRPAEPQAELTPPARPGLLSRRPS
jgi:hypothetical protein